MIWEWSTRPEIFHLGPLTLRWYGLLFLLSFVFGYRIMAHYFKKDKVPVDDVEHLFTYVFFGVLLGARLGHCLFYEPDIYLHQPWRIIMVWEGGLASHGTFFGLIAALALYVRKYSVPSYLWLADRICLALGQAAVLVRLGNFFNSEIVGRPTGSDWGVVFTSIDRQPRHPTQLYEAGVYLILFIALFLLEKRYRRTLGDGIYFGLFLITVFGARFVLEYFKEVQVSFETQLPLHMGQILSIPLVLLGVGLVTYSLKHRPALKSSRASSLA